MTCPQCNANLPDSMVFCPQCGSPVRSTTFSYLPAGAPAWPTIVPHMATTETGSSDQFIDQQDENPRADKLTPKPRRTARSILVLVAILVLTPLIGAAATLGVLWTNGQFPVNTTQASAHVPSSTQQPPVANQTPTSTSAQLPTPTSFQTVSTTTRNLLGIAMKYPQGWIESPTTQPTQSGLVSADFHPQQQLGIDVTLKRIPSKSLASATVKDVNQANVDVFGTYQNVNSLHTIASPTTQLSVGGVQWAEQDAAFVDNNQLPYHFTVLSVLHKQYYYSFTFYAPNNNYDEAMQKYIQPMLKSFQFQS